MVSDENKSRKPGELTFTAARSFARIDPKGFIVTPDLDGVRATLAIGAAMSAQCDILSARDVYEICKESNPQIEAYHKRAMLTGTITIRPERRRDAFFAGPWDVPTFIAKLAAEGKLDWLEFVPEMLYSLGNGNLRPERIFGDLEIARHFGFTQLIVDKIDRADDAELSRVWAGVWLTWVCKGLKLYPLSEFDDHETISTYLSKVVSVRPKAGEVEGVIHDISWETLNTGRIYPKAWFEPKLVLPQDGADPVELPCVPLLSAENVVRHQIGIEARVKVGVSPWMDMPIVTQVLTPSPKTKFAEPPTQCPACKAETLLEDDRWNYRCGSWVCWAKSRTPIYHLCQLAHGPQIHHAALAKWLDAFPVPGANTRISNLFELLMLFKQSGPKDTAHRAERIATIFGEPAPGGQAHYVSQIERKIDKKLKDGFTIQEFWFLSGLPKMDWATARKMSNLDPRVLREADVLIAKGLDHDQNSDLKHYKPQWGQLAELLKIADPAPTELRPSRSATMST